MQTRKRKREEEAEREAIVRLRQVPIMTAIAAAAEDGGYLHRVFSGDKAYAIHHGLIGEQYGNSEALRGKQMKDAHRTISAKEHYVTWRDADSRWKRRWVFENLGRKTRTYFFHDNFEPADAQTHSSETFSIRDRDSRRKRYSDAHARSFEAYYSDRHGHPKIETSVNEDFVAEELPVAEIENRMQKYRITDEDFKRAEQGKAPQADWYEPL